MSYRSPARAQPVLHRKTCEIEPRSTYEINGTIRQSVPSQCGNRVDGDLQFNFDMLQLFIGSLEVVNISVRSIPSDDLSLVASQWHGAKQEPAILRIEASHSCFRFSWFFRSEKALPRVHQLS